MKNKISDLNNYLFEQIEILNDSDLTGDTLKEAVIKAKAIKEIATAISQNQRLQLDAIKVAAENGVVKSSCFYPLLGVSKDA